MSCDIHIISRHTTCDVIINQSLHCFWLTFVRATCFVQNLHENSTAHFVLIVLFDIFYETMNSAMTTAFYVNAKLIINAIKIKSIDSEINTSTWKHPPSHPSDHIRSRAPSDYHEISMACNKEEEQEQQKHKKQMKNKSNKKDMIVDTFPRGRFLKRVSKKIRGSITTTTNAEATLIQTNTCEVIEHTQLTVFHVLGHKKA